MIGLNRPGALLGLAPALVLVMAGRDPTESPTEEPVDPDYAAGKPAMAVKDWPAAIRSLSSASLRDARNADIQNDLGHAYGQNWPPRARVQTLPARARGQSQHRGAHEDIVENYLIVDNLAKAEEQLAVLHVCLISCEEYEELKKAPCALQPRCVRC